MSPMYSTVKETLFKIFRLRVLITSITYITLSGKNTNMYEFLITRKLSIVANCSLSSNETMFFKWKFISNDIGKFLYSFNHLLHSDLSTIYFPSSLNKLKLFLSPSSDCSNTNHATRKKTLQKKLSCFPQQDNLPLGLTDVIFYIQVMTLVAFPCLPSSNG